MRSIHKKNNENNYYSYFQRASAVRHNISTKNKTVAFLNIMSENKKLR